METTLEPRQILIFACNGKNDAFTDEDLKKIHDFVGQGGYLFTSDWMLKSLTERAFPGKVAFAGETPRKEQWEVKIRPSADAAAHPYNRDVFPIDPFERANFNWKIHQRTHLLKLGAGVVTLVESEDLAQKLGETKKAGARAIPVAVTFRIRAEKVETGGKGDEAGGVVLHVLSHFEDQRTKDGDGFALQQLLLNFIVEKQRSKRTG